MLAGLQIQNEKNSDMQRIQEVWFLTSEIESESAGSFRQERWCSIFLELGVPVTIFNVRGAFGLTVARFISAGELREFRQNASSRGGVKPSVREGWSARVLRRIKHWFLIDLYLPNILFLILRANRDLRHSGRRVAIMGSSPPFALALAGAAIRAMHRGRVILAVDMRDAWSTHMSLGGSKRVKRWLESLVLRSADFTSAVSRGLRDELVEVHAIRGDVLYNVATHYFNPGDYCKVDWRSINPLIAVERIKLIYTGSTPQGFYDLVTLVAALKRFRSSDPSLADRIQFVFVGACAEVQRELRRQQFENDDVVFVPHVPHEMAKAIQQNADGLLYLTYVGKGAVSTKIFEYFALGKPILPLFVPDRSDVDVLLTTYCGKSLALHTDQAIVDVLRQIADENGLQFLPRLKDPGLVRHLLDDYKLYAIRLLSA